MLKKYLFVRITSDGARISFFSGRGGGAAFSLIAKIK